MTVKIKDFNRGLDQIEYIDKQIEKMLESENYSQVIEVMKERLQIISQLTQIKEKEGITEDMRARLNKIFGIANGIQEKVLEKRDKISKRLKERRKVKTQNKKIAY